MNRAFWIDKWEANEIGFHKSDVNLMLVSHIDRLELREGNRIFLPLCGKTRDIRWLLSQGYQVCGAELSALAVDQLFMDLGVEPTRSEDGALTRYSAEGIDIFVGDIFALTREMLGAVHAIYDRAAMVALPQAMRGSYGQQLIEISDSAPILLISFEYKQSAMNGPPFSVDENEVRRVYENRYELEMLERADVVGGLKGRCEADEVVWLLN